MRTLYDLSWQVPEETYREDPALSYSTLAKFERGGFNSIPSLFDKVESASLLFGSAVDCIITEGSKAFDERFVVADLGNLVASQMSFTQALYNRYSDTYKNLEDIPNEDIIAASVEQSFQLNWKPETRARIIKENCSQYYNLLQLTKTKQLLNSSVYQEVLDAVDALKTSAATSFYFKENSPFDKSIERFYQLKFKATISGIDFRIMMDLVIVNHNTKTITPCDLKTSSHKEYEFYKSFMDWKYYLQAKLYTAVLKQNLIGTEYEDYTIKPYKFIVVNKESLTPLVWEFDDSLNLDSFYINDTEYRGPVEIAKELTEYLTNQHQVPIGIEIDKSNSLQKFLGYAKHQDN